MCFMFCALNVCYFPGTNAYYLNYRHVSHFFILKWIAVFQRHLGAYLAWFGGHDPKRREQGSEDLQLLHKCSLYFILSSESELVCGRNQGINMEEGTCLPAEDRPGQHSRCLYTSTALGSMRTNTTRLLILHCWHMSKTDPFFYWSVNRSRYVSEGSWWEKCKFF